MLPLYHLHSRGFPRLVRAITPRNAFPPTTISRERLQSERVYFLSPRAFQPMGALSLGKSFEKTRFFLAFIFNLYYYSPILKKCQPILFVFQQIANFFQKTGIRRGFRLCRRSLRRSLFRSDARFFCLFCFDLFFALL